MALLRVGLFLKYKSYNQRVALSSMLIEDRKTLAEKIRSAFKDVSIPSYVGYELDMLQGKKWDEVSVDDLRWHADELASFTSEGFHYFLPSMLIAVILHSKESDVLTENIVDKLAPPIRENRSKKHFEMHQIQFNKRVEILDKQQKDAVRNFVNSYKELEPDGAWSFMDRDRLILEKAIEFWQ